MSKRSPGGRRPGAPGCHLCARPSTDRVPPPWRTQSPPWHDRCQSPPRSDCTPAGHDHFRHSCLTPATFRASALPASPLQSRHNPDLALPPLAGFPHLCPSSASALQSCPNPLLVLPRSAQKSSSASSSSYTICPSTTLNMPHTTHASLVPV